MFLGITVLFLVWSAFTLAKVIRDQQEAATVRVRFDEARMKRPLAEYDPFSTAGRSSRSCCAAPLCDGVEAVAATAPRKHR